MTINYGPRSLRTDSVFTFECNYLALKRQRQSASGFDSEGFPLFVLVDGVERLEPRASLWTGNVALWTPPTVIQVRALLFQYHQYKDLWTNLMQSAKTPSRLAKSGIKTFHTWRFVCDLVDIPIEPLVKARPRRIDFGQDSAQIAHAADMPNPDTIERGELP